MVATFPKKPHKSHWDSLIRIAMSPDEFLSHWNVTYAELAQICRCSENTVKRWFTNGSDRRQPKETHKALMSFTHREWQRRELVQDEDVYLWDLYQQVIARK